MLHKALVRGVFILDHVKDILVSPSDRALPSREPDAPQTRKGSSSLPVSAPIKQSKVRFWMNLSSYTLIWVFINGMFAAVMMTLGIKAMLWGLNYAVATPSVVDYAKWLVSQPQGVMAAASVAVQTPSYWQAIWHAIFGAVVVMFSSPIIWTGLEGFIFVGKGLVSLTSKTR
jgi:hypothetical protein